MTADQPHTFLVLTLPEYVTPAVHNQLDSVRFNGRAHAETYLFKLSCFCYLKGRLCYSVLDIEGDLACKKQRLPGTLKSDYASGPTVVLLFLMSEVPL